MSDTSADASLARVKKLLAAARKVKDDPAIVKPLLDSTGLSAMGIYLALARYLETEAPAEDLAVLVKNAAPRAHVHVILSAHVFTAPLRALAVAWAASERVTVSPSRREPVFARALVAALDDPRVVLSDREDAHSIEHGEVHVYGHDETVSAIKSAARPGVVVRGHGTGMGVAFVTASSPMEAGHGIAEDVVVFDQRGCLSPRIVMVLGSDARATAVAEALHTELTALEEQIPRGALAEDEHRDAVRYAETMAFAGKALRGKTHVVGVGASTGPLVLPPPGRHVHVVPVATTEQARALLVPFARYVVAIGCDDEAMGRRLVPDRGRVRLSPLGRMQEPPLDGPVDLR